MTVADAIKRLQSMPQQAHVHMMIDCPKCGYAAQLESVDTAVVLSSRPAKEVVPDERT